MKRVLCLSLALILCFSLIGCDENSHEGEVKTPAGSSDMEGRNYEDVVTIFEEKGFTNIKTEPIDDLIFGWLTKDGEVEEVSVGGKVDYSPDKWVPADTEVVIRYHTFPQDDEEETKSDESNETTESTTIVMTADSVTYTGKNAQDVEKEVKDLGFENVKLVESATTDTSNTDGAVDTITVAGEGFNKGDSFKKDAEIVIIYWKVEKIDSEYEKAFVRAMSNYSLYYMFDTDNKTVIYFGTNDTYIEKGTYTGEFSSGVTINWSHGEWTEKFTNKDGNNDATLVDGNGFDWEYKVCSVVDAQKVLDGLK